MNAAIFDVDRTLLDGMAGYYFNHFLWFGGHMRRAGRWQTAKSIALYRTRLRPEVVMVEAGVTGLAGLSETHVTALAQRCVDEVIWPKIFTEALEAIARHRAEGDFVLLASGSSRPIVETLARRVGAHDCVATDGVLDENGVYLPRFQSPLCYDVGKTRLTEDRLAREGLHLSDAVFYTDNHQDLTLLERVARPVCVNPDGHLLPIAQRRHWPIERWHRAVGGEGTGTFGPLRSE